MAQMCFVGLFAYILLTWHHVHHASMEPLDLQRQRRQVLAISVTTFCVCVAGALCVSLLPGQFAVAEATSVVLACATLLLSLMFAFYGYKVGKGQKKRIQTVTNKTQKNQEQEAIRTWQLTCLLSVLFILQSLAWVLSVTLKAVDGVSLVYHSACVATMAVTSATYRRVWKQQLKSVALRSSRAYSSRQGSSGHGGRRSGTNRALSSSNNRRKKASSHSGVRKSTYTGVTDSSVQLGLGPRLKTKRAPTTGPSGDESQPISA
eukprot:CAMPEP_0175148142 /NCGR_PEP_ID=MMETSP0087-20121206/16437_1 /TAXON_ID=136419 /ORGANISM="Unknown Unknown, Strain D1" /LENGTH=261 /DNA_ID=CAMNT_0016433517 /DNA_START=1001 /DNA_END=1786 /DNA_ORIENTATION=+